MPQITKVTVGQFAKELVLQLEPLDDLLSSWELTKEEYEELRKSEFFQQELLHAVEEVKSMGSDAGFVMRAKILSESFLPNIVTLMENANTPPEVKVNIFRHMTELARLQPPKNAGYINAPSGPSVVFNFGMDLPGLPKSLTIDTPKLIKQDG